MKEKLAEFFNQELIYTMIGLDREKDPKYRSDICWYAIQRGLGATTFAQMCGMTFEEVELMYEEYKKKLEGIMHEMY